MESRNDILVVISCITFNHEPYIRDCLDGFVMQKTNFKFVAIVHDDASTDKTADIIREYEAKYPDIIKPIYETDNQYSKRDGSLDKIMNDAIDATGAKYVACCEGDDYWIDPYKLQKQVDVLEADKTLMGVMTNRRLVDMQGNTLEEKSDRIVPDNKMGRYTLRQFFKDNPQYPTASVMYRNTHTADVRRMQAHTANAYLGDWTLWIILHTFGDFYYLDDVTSAYRINPNSVTHTCDRVGRAKANWQICPAVADILPEQYADIADDLRHLDWVWWSVALAHKHEHHYIRAIGCLIVLLFKDPKCLYGNVKRTLK